MLFLLLILGEEPKVHPELLKEDESEDGLRSQPHKGRDVALVEGHGALPHGRLEHVHRTGELALRTVFKTRRGLPVVRHEECLGQ